VFKVTAAGNFTLFYSFAGAPNDGFNPYGGLIRDSSGNLYGTTDSGIGECTSRGTGCGAAFTLSPSGHEKVLHLFDGSDGANPEDCLTTDAAGNFYGTTYWLGPTGYGTVFRIYPTGALTTLYSFAGGTD
jgi:uncharacterized repeat protein (TIGR03803 family)